MGGGSSKGTPLQCFLDHWKEATEGDDWGFPLRKERLRSLCEVDWPTQGTGWPSEGSFDENLINPLWRTIIDNHPDQIPYISTWKDAVDHNPPWLRGCRKLPPRAKICSVQKLAKHPPVLDSQEEELMVPRPPPYAPLVQQPQNADPPAGAEGGQGNRVKVPNTQTLEEIYPNLRELREKISRYRSSNPKHKSAAAAYSRARNQALKDYAKRCKEAPPEDLIAPLRVVWNNPPHLMHL